MIVINRYTRTICQRNKTHTHAQTICLSRGFKCGFTLWENAPYEPGGGAQAVILSVSQLSHFDCLLLKLADVWLSFSFQSCSMPTILKHQ